MEKMNVEGIMSKDFAEVQVDTRVSEVAKIMSDKNASCAIVFKREQPIGMVTRKDLVVKVLACGSNPEDTEIRAVCSSPLTTLSHDADIQDGVKLMMATGRGHIVVEKDRKPIGILGYTQIAPSYVTSSALLGGFMRLPGDPPTSPRGFTTSLEVLKSPDRFFLGLPAFPDHMLYFYKPMKFCPKCRHPKEEDVRCTRCGTLLLNISSIDSDSELGEKFKEGSVPEELRAKLESDGLSLPKNPTVMEVEDKKWVITERENVYIYVVLW